MTKLKLGWGTFVFGLGLAAFAQSPVITSFSQNGQLVCSNLTAGGVATVEWASTLAGPWRTNWSGLEAVTANSNGVIQVGVPMFYRVRATAVTTNHAPVAVDDTDTTTEDTAFIQAANSYLANDTDSDGDPLTITAVFSPINGTVALAGDTITFTPVTDFSGTAGYDYIVSDGSMTDAGHVTVTVTPVNDPPIPVDDFDITSLNTSLVRATSVYLANDMDGDSPLLSIIALSNPVNGVVSLVGTTITFTPVTDFTGAAGFDYTVSDGTVSETGHVTVLVN